MGSTPTGASRTNRPLVACCAAILLGLSQTAHAQFPNFGGMFGPTQVPGSAPSRVQEEELGIGPYARTDAPPASGETVRRYTEEEMQSYFDGRIADEYFEAPGCEPGVNDRVCYSYFSVDCLYWDRVHPGGTPVATFTATGAAAMMPANIVWNDFETLPRLTAGFVFDFGWGLEASYLYKDDFESGTAGFSENNLNLTVFGTPSAAFAPNFLGVDVITMSDSLSLHSFEVNVVQTNNYFNVIAGLRCLEFEENFALTAIDNATNTFATTNLHTLNKLIGAQLGFRMTQNYMGIYNVITTIKGGYYINYGDLWTTVAGAGAGLPDQTRYTRGNSDAAVGEAEIMATYNPRIWFQFRAGLQVFSIFQTASAPYQNFNSDNTGNYMRESNDVIFWGPFAGCEFRF